MLMLWHFAEEDDSHEKIMTTKRNLMEDEEYDADEAIRIAVKNVYFLYNLSIINILIFGEGNFFFIFFNIRQRKNLLK